MTIADFIKVFPAFHKSSDVVIKELLAAGRHQVIPAGTQIYHEGDACSAIAFVLYGDIRVYKIGPGETCILNASCILSGQAYPANAVTLSETGLFLVPSAEFRRLIAEHEKVRDFIFTLLSRRLTGVMELVEEVAFGHMDERLLDYLVEKSADNRLETTHQKIANDLGTSREVVSRLLKDLERKGRVRLSRNAVSLLDQFHKT